MMLKLLTLFVFVGVALALAPFHPQAATVDRADGHRSYFVILKESVIYESSQVQAWLRNEIPGSGLSDIGHVYEIGSFKGFSIWLSESGLLATRQSSFVKYVEANSYAFILPIANEPVVSTNATSSDTPFLTRADWGQIRADQRSRDLTTEPADLYSSGRYASGGADDWNWNGPTFTPINDGSKAVIWVLDTGIYIDHNEFKKDDGTSRVEEVRNFVVDTPPVSGDCNGHGTHCSGSAAGRHRGVATNARLRGVRVLGCGGSGTWDGVVAGINYIANNQVKDYANILSASLGGGFTQAVNDAIDAAARLGVINVVAAGNSNADTRNYSPASAAGAIAVAASGSDDSIASFSNWGEKISVFAPGVNVHSAWIGTPSSYYTASGTSMACPLVAGAIALVATRGEPDDGPLNQAYAEKLLASDGTRGKILGLTGNKAATKNVLIFDKWETEN